MRGKPRGKGAGGNPAEKEAGQAPRKRSRRTGRAPRRRRRGKPRGKGAEGRGTPRGGGGGGASPKKEEADAVEAVAAQDDYNARKMFFPLYAVIWQLLAVASFNSRFDILDIAEFSPSICSETPSHV